MPVKWYSFGNQFLTLNCDSMISAESFWRPDLTHHIISHIFSCGSQIIYLLRLVTVSSCILPSDSAVNITASTDHHRKGTGKSGLWARSHFRWKIQITNILFTFRLITSFRNTNTLFLTLSRLSRWLSTTAHGMSWFLSFVLKYSYWNKSESFALIPFRHQSDLYYQIWKHALSLVPDWQRGKIILFLNSHLNILSQKWVTIYRVWIGNLIYWTLTDCNYQ
jgi:hypothetical protein